MGNLIKRGKVYYADYIDGTGHRRRPSLQTQDLQVARERLRAKELLAANPAAHSTESLKDAIETMLVSLVRAKRSIHTIGCYTDKAGHLIRVLNPDGRIIDLKRRMVMTYIATRREENASNHTIHKELVVLRLTLKHARDRETWAGDVAQIVPAHSSGYIPGDRWLEYVEYRAIMREIRERWRFWFVVACNTGMRDDELARFSWEWIRGKTIIVQQTKPKPRKRVVPITAELEAWLWLVPDEERSGLVLKPWTNRRRSIALACKRAGVVRVSPNDLRRTLASWLLQSGVDVFTVSRILGHKSTRMVEAVYGHLCERNYIQAIGALDGVNANWDAGGTYTVPSLANSGLGWHNPEVMKSRKSQENVVPRDGIEPSTRGFSVPSVQVTKPKTFKVLGGGKR